MKRFVVGLAAPVLALGLVTACSGNPDTATDKAASSTPSNSATGPGASPSGDPAGTGTAYCELLGTDFTTMFANITGPQDAAKAVDVMKQVAAEAPSEVQDDWKVLGGSLDEMKVALTKAAKLQKQAKSGKVSNKELKQQMANLMRQTQSLGTAQTVAAGEAVAKNAAEYCGINLGG